MSSASNSLGGDTVGATVGVELGSVVGVDVKTGVGVLVGVAVGTGVGVGVSVDVGSGVAVDVGGVVAEGIVVGGAGSASSVRDSADEVATDGESAVAPSWVGESCILDSFAIITSGDGTGVG